MDYQLWLRCLLLVHGVPPVCFAFYSFEELFLSLVLFGVFFNTLEFLFALS